MSVGPPTLTHLLAAERQQVSVERNGASPRARVPRLRSRQWFEAEPLWFKSAVFYEIHVRGFFDANGDGMGDFPELTEKYEGYLQWLGIDCI